RFGSDWRRYEQAGPGVDFGGAADFADIFETLFGSRGRRGAGFNVRMDGQDVEQTVEITLEEAFLGTQRMLQFSNPNGSPRTITVKIPAGADTGTKVRVPGEGGPGLNGGNRGDLYLVVRVLPHQRYERKGEDLYVKVETSLYTLLLGGQVQVPARDGQTINLTTPEQTQHGRTFRRAGQGVPRLRSG